jgi:hypothetical protein
MLHIEGLLENTHPWLYRGYVFAHKGTIGRSGVLKLLSPEYEGLEGDTNSEVVFHLMVQVIESSDDIMEGVGGIVTLISYLSSGAFIFKPSLSSCCADERGVSWYWYRNKVNTR